MNNLNKIGKENSTALIKKTLLLIFAISMLLFIFIGFEYKDVLDGPRNLNEYSNYLSFENPEILSGEYVEADVSNVKGYFVEIKYRWNNIYYYSYKEKNSGLIVTIAVDELRKDEIDHLVKSGNEVSLKGTLSLMDNNIYQVAKLTLEREDSSIIGDNFWNEVSPYIINVDRLSLFSVSTGKMVFYITLYTSTISAILHVYFSTKYWKNNKIFAKEINVKNETKDIILDLNNIEVISARNNKFLLGKDYIFSKKTFYINTYMATNISDLRWLRIQKVFTGVNDYLFIAVNKYGNESIIAVCRGKKEMSLLVDKVIRLNDKIILGDIEEIKDKKLTLKKNKEEVMNIVNDLYKNNTYSYMKDKK